MIDLFKSWMNRYFSDPQVIILGVMLIAGFLLVFKFGPVLTPVFASVVIAYLLDGMVNRLTNLKIPHLGAVLIVFILFMACLLLIILVMLPMLVKQIDQLIQYLPENIKKVQGGLFRLPQKYPDYISETQLRQIIDSVTNELTKFGNKSITLLMSWVKGAITILVYFILVPLMVFFFLKDKALIIAWVANFLPENRAMATEVWRDLNRQISNYIRGKLWEILIIWGASYFTFKFLGLNFAMLISLFVGLSVLVPYIGATVIYIPVTLIAYFQWGWGKELLIVFIAYTIIQALDGNLLVPLLLSGVVNLHPVAIIVAVLMFGGMWGIWGLFFAIPLATLVNAVLKALYNRFNKNESNPAAEAS